MISTIINIVIIEIITIIFKFLSISFNTIFIIIIIFIHQTIIMIILPSVIFVWCNYNFHVPMTEFHSQCLSPGCFVSLVALDLGSEQTRNADKDLRYVICFFFYLTFQVFGEVDCVVHKEIK